MFWIIWFPATPYTTTAVKSIFMKWQSCNSCVCFTWAPRGPLKERRGKSKNVNFTVNALCLCCPIKLCQTRCLGVHFSLTVPFRLQTGKRSSCKLDNTERVWSLLQSVCCVCLGEALACAYVSVLCSNSKHLCAAVPLWLIGGLISAWNRRALMAFKDRWSQMSMLISYPRWSLSVVKFHFLWNKKISVDPRQIPAITATLKMIHCFHFCCTGWWTLLCNTLLSLELKSTAFIGNTLTVR